MNTPTTTWMLFAEGWLSGWMALLLAAAAGAFVLWQLRREFARRQGPLVRWVLPGLRLAIVALLCWLLAQPVLRRLQTEPQMPRLLIAVDTAASMQTQMTFTHPAQKLDLLASLEGRQPPGRDPRASTLARALAPLQQLLSTTLTDLRRQEERRSMGLPQPGETSQSIGRLLAQLRERLDRLPLEDLPEPRPEHADALRDTLAEALRTRTALIGHTQVLLEEGPLVIREAANHPNLLATYIDTLVTALATTEELIAQAYIVQNHLDTAAITPEVREALTAQTLTRAQVADAIAARLERRNARRYAVETLRASGLAALQTAALAEHLREPAAAMLLLSDGAGAGAVDAPPMPVHALLVGEAGREPEDAAVLAVQGPALAVAGEPLTLHLLIKHLLPEGDASQVVISQEARVLARLPIAETGEALALDAEVALTEPGAQLLQIRLENANGQDAYPGNEQMTLPLKVLPAPARVLLTGQGLSHPFATWHAILTSQPALDVDALVAAPELSELKLGTEPGTLPATADAWKEYQLLVVLGELPTLLQADAEAMAALETAREGGLAVLELRQGSESIPMRLQPSADWRPLHRLGIDREASLAAWAALPMVPGMAIETPGVPLLLAQAQDQTAPFVLAATTPADASPRTTVVGLADVAALRTPRTQQAVNHLVAGLVAETLVPSPALADQTWLANDIRAYVLAPQAAPLAALASATDGSLTPLDQLDGWRPLAEEPAPIPVIHVASWPLWPGAWSLIVLLILVSTEYLLRRRAGRVL